MPTFNNIKIVSPKQSFIKFGAPEIENDCCLGDDGFCIPVIEEGDLWFQFNLESIDSAKADEVMTYSDSSFHLKLLSGTGNVNTTVAIAAAQLRDFLEDTALFFQVYRTGPTTVTLLWKNNLTGIKDLLECNECFEFAVDIICSVPGIEWSGERYTAISNCFIRKCDDCFTSLLEYTNTDDDFGFNYCNTVNPINKVRLPFFFMKPQYKDDESIYMKSDGAIKITKSVTQKEYSADTEMFPEHIHEKLKIALSHDSTIITGDTYTGGFRKNGSYNIDWDDLFLCKAKANFKALVSPYDVKNSNCETCKELDGVYLCNSQIGEVTYADRTVNWTNPFGGAPFKWQIFNPAISGGAPKEVDGGILTFAYSSDPMSPLYLPCGEYLITVKPICKIDGELYAGAPKSVTMIVECPCIGATVAESVVIPDGVVGVYLDYSFDIDGTEPFYITDEVRPSWMSIVLDGNTVHIYGTPSAPGTDIPVSFTISNCTETDTTITYPFSQTINVTS